MTFKLWYSVHDGGDSSAYPKFFTNAAEAEQDQLEHNEYEGWAEECFGYVTLKIIDGKLFLIDREWCDKTEKYKTINKPLKGFIE